jgi:fumarate hydratase class II
VTALNPIIGYNKGAEVAKKALAENKSVREVVLEMGLMSEDEVDAALDIRKMTEGGIHK